MALPRLRRVLLDTSACIYFLDGSPDHPRHRAVADLVQRVDRGQTAIVLSPITVAELLVLPIRTADVEAEAMVRLFASRLCEIASASGTTASLAASIRSAHRLRLPDALVIATSIEHRVDAVVGNDVAWKRVTEIRYLHIDDHVEPVADDAAPTGQERRVRLAAGRSVRPVTPSITSAIDPSSAPSAGSPMKSTR